MRTEQSALYEGNTAKHKEELEKITGSKKSCVQYKVCKKSSKPSLISSFLENFTQTPNMESGLGLRRKKQSPKCLQKEHLPYFGQEQ